MEPAQVSDVELALANRLIQHLGAKRFDPNEYVDEFKALVQATVDRKVAGKEVRLSEASPPRAVAM